VPAHHQPRHAGPDARQEREGERTDRDHFHDVDRRSATTAGPKGRRKSAKPGKEVESGDRGTPFGLVITMALLAVLISAPLIWMLSTAFKTTNEMASADLNILPANPSTQAFDAILGADQTPVIRWFFNSMLAATLHTILVLVVCSLAAYALARLDFPGRKIFTGLILATIFVPPISLLIPSYVIVDNLGWLDRMIAVIVPGAAGAFGVFFLRQFFLSLPASWRRRRCSTAPTAGPSSGRSCSRCPGRRWRPWRCCRSSPTGTTSCGRSTSCSARSGSPCSPGLSTLQSAYTTDYSTIMAGGVIASIPVLILFAITQRFVIEGVSRSGMKG
jgi:multiple sugar transport system permease protein